MFCYLFVFSTWVIMSLSSTYKDIVQFKEDGFSPLHTVLNIVQTCFLQLEMRYSICHGSAVLTVSSVTVKSVIISRKN